MNELDVIQKAETGIEPMTDLCAYKYDVDEVIAIIKQAKKETIEDRHRIHTINLECARQGVRKEVFDDIDDVFQLNDNEAIRIYSTCGCCSRFVKKLLEVKKRQLNTSNTDSENKE